MSNTYINDDKDNPQKDNHKKVSIPQENEWALAFDSIYKFQSIYETDKFFI